MPSSVISNLIFPGRLFIILGILLGGPILDRPADSAPARVSPVSADEDIVDRMDLWQTLDPRTVALDDYLLAESAMVSANSGSGGYFLDKDQIRWIRASLASFKSRGIELPADDAFDRHQMITQSYYHMDDDALIASKPQSIYYMNWQTSGEVSDKICIRNKFGIDGAYTVTFVVTGPNGHTYRTSRDVNGDEWVEISFPKDFRDAVGVDLRPGFTWKAIVNRRVVVSGALS